MTFDTRAPLSIQASRTVNVGRGSGGVPSEPGHGVIPDLFYDFFASGDFSAPDGPEPALNNSGFSWGNPNRTSIVTQDPVNGNTIVSATPPNIQNDSRDWTALIGENSIRFRYPIDADISEQRFSIGSANPELWMSFWLRVPTNFTHPGANHKLMAMWMDAYSARGDGSTALLEFRPSTEGARFYINYSQGRNQISGGDIGSTHFISVPEDRGRWMQLVIQLIAESSEDADDGAFNVWRKWAGDASYNQTHNLEGIRLRVPELGPSGWSAGYLMGWTNNRYTENTEWLLDGFKLSTLSLLEV